MLQFYGNDLCQRLMVGLSSGEHPLVSLLDADGRALIGMGTTAVGRIGLSVNDANGRPAVKITVHPDGQRTIHVFGRDQKLVWSANA